MPAVWRTGAKDGHSGPKTVYPSFKRLEINSGHRFDQRATFGGAVIDAAQNLSFLSSLDPFPVRQTFSDSISFPISADRGQ